MIASRWRRRGAIPIVALLLAACGGGGGGGAPRAPVLRIPIINDPIMNPVIAPDIGSVLVNKVIFAGLVRPDENLKPAPDLAASWTISEDGCTYTFALQPNAHWHDGRPVRAEDVKFTFDRITEPNSGSRLRSDFATIDRVEVVDSLTVRFTLSRPFAPFLTLLGYNAGILPAHVLRGTPLTEAVDFNRAHPIGSGPYKVVEVVPGSAITLVPHDGHHGGRPLLGGVVFRVVPDLNAQVAQLRAGELDLLTLEPSQLASVEHTDGIRILQANAVQHFYVAFNQDSARFKSPLVRRALVHAVNRGAIIDGILKGYADYPQGTIPIALREFYADSLPRIPYDTARALQLLAQAGWRRDANRKLMDAAGRPFAFVLLVDKGNPTREQAALAVQHDLEGLGMAVTMRTLEFATLVRDFVLPHKYDAILIWWTTPPDPDQYSFYATGQDNNNVGYSNPRVDSLLLEGRRTSDPVERRRIYLEFQRLEAEDPPVLVLYYPREILAASARLSGLPRLPIRDALRWTERLQLER